MAKKVLVFALISIVLTTVGATANIILSPAVVQEGTGQETPKSLTEAESEGPSTQNEESTAESATQPETDAYDWKVYRNEEYGFELMYPIGFLIEYTGIPNLMLDPIVRLRLADERYYRGTNLKEAAIIVTIGRGTQNVSSCLQPEALGVYSGDTLAEVEINGVIFHKDVVSEGAAGHRYEKIGYHTIHGEACYGIILFIHSVNIGVLEPGAVSQFNREAILERLREVMLTFSFLG